MNPYLYDMMLQEKRREMLEEAARQRLLASYAAPPRTSRILAALGNALIAAGERLLALGEQRLPVSREGLSHQHSPCR